MSGPPAAGQEPSAAAIASLITQVPQSGHVQRGAARPVKVPTKKKPSTKKVSSAPGAEAKRAKAAEAGAAAAAEQAGTVASSSCAPAEPAAPLVLVGTSVATPSDAATQNAPAKSGEIDDGARERAHESSSGDATLVEQDAAAAKGAAGPSSGEPADPTSSKTGAGPSAATGSTTTTATAAPTKSVEPASTLPSSGKPAPVKKKRRLIHILLPCIAASQRHYDDNDDDALATAGASLPSKKGNNIEMTTRTPNGARAATITQSPSPSNAAAKKTPGKPAKPLKIGRGSTGSSTSTPRTVSGGGTPIAAPPTPVADTTTAAGAAAATAVANAGGGGVQLPRDETEGILSGAVVPPGKEGATSTPKKTPSKAGAGSTATSAGAAAGVSTGAGKSLSGEEVSGSEDSEPESGEDESEGFGGTDEEDEEDKIVAMGGMGIPVDEDGTPRPLLEDLDLKVHAGRKCLVLDLDETLVHSSFKMIHHADFIVPVEIENSVHNVYVIKRPGVDQFMKRMGELYEIVVFTASLSKYADPVLDMLDIHRVVKHRLFRESCYNHRGNYVKDLSQLGRPIGETIIIDNSPASYIFHPNNAVPVSSWFNDPHDTELTDLVSFLADVAEVPDVRAVLDPRLA